MAETTHTGHPPNILLAEDDPVSQRITLQMLKMLGYNADTAVTGLEVLLALECRSYDVVLMDIQMPEMNGIEATKRIRRRWSSTPKIVFVTACIFYRKDCFDVGGNDFLAKPIKMEELQAAIERNTI